MGRYIRGNINELLNVGTLAAATVISADFDNVVDERTLVTSIVSTYSVDSWTQASDIGPLVVGVAHSDYSDAEIQEWFTQTVSWDEGNKIAQEINNRKIRVITTLQAPLSATGVFVANDGKPIKTKLNWILTQGQTLSVFAFNAGTAAFATTDPDVRMEGHANLFPQ